MQDDLDVIIIGAGLAGLAAALRLSQNGKRLLVIESNDYIGGRVSSESIQGFILDRGFQVFLTAYPECQIQLNYKALELNAFQKGAFVYNQRSFRRFAHPFDVTLNTTGLMLAALSAQDFLAIPKLCYKLKKKSTCSYINGPSISVIDYLRQEGLSERIIEEFFRPFLSGVFLDRSLNCSGQMLPFILKMFLDGDAYLPKKGMQAIPNQLAAKIPQSSFLLNTKVTQIHEGGVSVSQGARYEAKNVLIATDLWNAYQLLGLPAIDQGRGATCCYFAAEHAPMEEPALVLNRENNTPVNHLAVISNVAPSYAPQNAALISVTTLQNTASSDPGQIEKDMKQELRQWFGSEVMKWQLLKTYFLPHSHPADYPIQPWSSENKMKIRKGLYACGDYLAAPNIHSTLEIGRKSAELILTEGRSS
jgi:phytoene dehydrogenase-like protein